MHFARLRQHFLSRGLLTGIIFFITINHFPHQYSMKVSLLFREWLEIETGYIYIQILVQLENQVLCYFLYLKRKKKKGKGGGGEENLVPIVTV